MPPSGEAVSMKGVTSASIPNKVKIDDLLAELTLSTNITSNNLKNPVDQRVERWPFIPDDIPMQDWNSEINPETEINVSYSAWIPGLPTTVAEIRPWSLFINLSGVELLFGQENKDGDWDQYWVPYKCAFSPKRTDIPSVSNQGTRS